MKCELHTDTDMDYDDLNDVWWCWRCEWFECPKCGDSMSGEDVWVCGGCGYTYDWEEEDEKS